MSELRTVESEIITAKHVAVGLGAVVAAWLGLKVISAAVALAVKVVLIGTGAAFIIAALRRMERA